MFKNISLQKTLNYIMLVLLFFCIVYSSMLCGSPLNNNTVIINLLLNILALCSIVINQFVYHKKIQYNKYDLIILFLSFMYFIPIVFRTYASISDTFDYLLRYISIFCVYIIIKNLNIGEKKVTFLLHGILLGAIFIIILGIDDMSTRIFQNLHLFFNTYSSPLGSDVRLDSVFEYPNAFAAFINFSCLLAIGLFFKTENKYLKGLYGSVVGLHVIAVVLSGSRLNIALFIATLFIYLAFVRKKFNILPLIELFFVIFFCALFYGTKYLNLIQNKQYAFMWGILILELFFIYGFCLLFHFMNHKLQFKISIKKYIVFFISAIIVLFIIIFILFQISDSLTLFDSQNRNRRVTIAQINEVESNKEYLFEFNVEASSGKTGQDDTYQIIIFELNDQLENISFSRIKFDEFIGWKSCSLTTHPNTKYLKIACKASILNEYTKLTIKDCYVDHQKMVINYKFLPSNLVLRLSNMFSGDNSLQDRFTFISDGIKIGIQHFFTGSGANGWKYKFQEVQTTPYYTTEVHSYPTQLFIEIGFLGIFLYILLVVCLARIAYCQFKKEESNILWTSCLFAVIYLLLHSLIDFDMSFFSVLLQFYTVIILIINANIEEKSFTIKRKKEISFYVFSIIVILASIRLNLGSLVSNNLTLTSSSSTASLELSEKVLKLNPYNREARLIRLSNQNIDEDMHQRELEVFFQFEPSYPDIDDLKISYVIKLLESLNSSNLTIYLNKIHTISYSTTSSKRVFFRQNLFTALELIKEKSTLYPDESFDLLYDKYSSLLSYE